MIKKSCITGFIVVIIYALSTLSLGSVDNLNELKNSAFSYYTKPPSLINLVEEYDNYLQQAIIAAQSPGAAVAIVYKGEILLLKGYGIRKTGGNDSVNIHTAFRLGSVSKGFASVLTGVMVNEGYINWDDKIKKYLPEFSMKDTFSENALTIKNILSQTSGFPEHTYTDLLDNGYCFENIKGLLSNVPSYSKPGLSYSYQNVVYSLIGDILQTTSSESYVSLLKDKIFTPLKMNDASADFETFQNNINSAFPHLRAGNSWKSKPKNNRYYTVAPASGINASACDMSKWLLALTGYNLDVIPKNTLEEIAEPYIQTPRRSVYRKYWQSLEKTYYSLGWRVFKLKNHDVVYHGGYVEGFRTEIAYDPIEEIGIAVMFNSNTQLASYCVPYFLNSFYSESYNLQENILMAVK